MIYERVNKWIGPAHFYRLAAAIAVPLVLQQLVQNSLANVDSAMVTRVGGLIAVSVGAQIENIMNMGAFGINSGIAIYAAQYYGAKDYTNLKKIFGLQLVINMVNAIMFMLIAFFLGRAIIGFYSPSDGKELIIDQGMYYLMFAMYSYIPASIGFSFAYMYRNIQKTVVPLLVSIGVMTINVCLNAILIFGMFGLPRLEVGGAALATSIATMVGMLVHILYAYQTKQPFMGSIKEMFSFDWQFAKPIIGKLLPVLFNEYLFGIGMSLYIKAFGMLGKESLESYRVGTNIAMFFFPIVTGVNAAVASLLGSELGKQNIKRAKEYSRYFIVLCLGLALIVGVVIVVTAEFLVTNVYAGLSPAITEQAILITQLFSLRISLRLFNSFFFSSLRAGGDAKYLLFIDGGIMWLVGLPITFAAVMFFGVKSVVVLFAINQIEQLVRLVLGSMRFKQGVWLKTLVKKDPAFIETT